MLPTVTLRTGVTPRRLLPCYRGDVFSWVLSLPTSYTGMRPEPYPRGRCHNANYWTQVQILSSDVAGSHSITVPGEATLFIGTVEDAPLRLTLAPMSTDRTRLAGVAFLLQGYHHAVPLSLIGEQMPHGPMRPLMEFLIVGGANIHVLSDMPDIANDHGLHALCMQCGNKMRGLLVLDIPNLMLEFPELFLLGTNEFLPPTGTFLLPVDLLRKMLLQFV